jgi:hypothetical protein
MSVKVMSAVFNRYEQGGGEMLLALALADVARDDGRLMINDSVPELARKTRQTERGVQGQLKRMVASGWLKVVRASDGGRSRVAVYAIDANWIDGGELQAHPANPETPNGATENPERGSGFEEAETPNGATKNPERGSGAYRPTRPNTEIPPNPPSGGKPDRKEPNAKEPSVPKSLQAWLAECKAKGEKALPADDPVYAYAEQVGISVELLHLHWAEFKVRRGESTKRQRDWRQTFRNSVRDNWFRLWWVPPGKPAEITSAGRQAMAAQDAQTA